MNNQLKVSVIIPSYNYARYIREAIESVLSQTYKDIEIIVVDDGSTDNTKEVLEPYIREGKIRYLYQENRGPSAARNAGLKTAQGQYIKFLDSDDFLYTEQIERQVEQIKTSDNLFSISDHCILRPNGEKIKRKYYPPDDERQLNAFIEANQAPIHAFLIPKPLIQKVGYFDEALSMGEDWDLWIRILMAGALIRHLPYVGCCYRMSTISLSADMEKMLIQRCKVIEKVNTWLLKEENLAKYERKWFWFASVLRINIKLFEESIARRIPFEDILVNALRMTDWIFRAQKNLFLKALHRLIGTKNYIRIGYYIKIMFKKNYRFNLLNVENLWKLGQSYSGNGKSAFRKKMPNFLFFRNLKPDGGWGGTEVVLMDWLSQIDYGKCKITLAVPEGSKEIFSQHIQTNSWPVDILEYKFPVYRSKGWARFCSMLRFFSQIRPSAVIFVQGWYTDFYFSEILAGFVSTPGKVFIHENVGPKNPPVKESKKHFGFIPGLAIWWYKMTFFVYAKAYLCRKVLFVSKDIREKFIRLWEYPKHNSLVMHHGTEVSRYSPSRYIRVATRETLHIAQTDIIIIATARLAKFKCLDRLINAFDAISRDFGNLHLLLAGTGPLEKELKNLAASKASGNRIRFLGHVDNVPDLLRSSDIYVLSSDNEGLSLALLEAMASGLICISTLCPGSPEVIEDSRNGFLVAPNSLGVEQAIRKALGLNSDERIRISQNARQTVFERFNVERNAKNVLRVFGVPFKK